MSDLGLKVLIFLSFGILLSRPSFILPDLSQVFSSPELKTEAKKVAKEMARRANVNVDHICHVLAKHGYEHKRMKLPVKKYKKAISGLEKKLGNPAPLSFKYFWKYVGEVRFLKQKKTPLRNFNACST
jgi:hypothetical protein